MAYYHVLIETIEKRKNGKYEEPVMAYAFDIPESEKDVKIVRDIALQYITGQEFFVDGRPLVKERVARIEIVKTDCTSNELVDQAYASLPANVATILHKERVVFNNRAKSVFADMISDARTMALNNNLDITTSRVFEPQPTKQTVYNTTVNATNALVQAGAVKSQQTMIVNNDMEQFAKLTAELVKIDNHDDMIVALEELKQAIVQNDKTNLVGLYSNFIATVANHMTVVAPFIPWLTSLL
jgi:hypothetical protein